MLEVRSILRRDGELDPTDGEAALLVAMSAATIDRRLDGERAKMIVGGRSHTKPGSLLKSQIPHRTRTHTHRGRSGHFAAALQSEYGASHRRRNDALNASKSGRCCGPVAELICEFRMPST